MHHQNETLEHDRILKPHKRTPIPQPGHLNANDSNSPIPTPPLTAPVPEGYEVIISRGLFQRVSRGYFRLAGFIQRVGSKGY